MIVNNKNGLIGDFIGTIPAMEKYASLHGGFQVILASDKMRALFNLIPKKYGITETKSDHWDMCLNSSDAFSFGRLGMLHMNQSYYHLLNMPVPSYIPRPELEVKSGKSWDVDYVISPFSRSLPAEQRWPQERWQWLVNCLPDKKFVLTGESGVDREDYVTGSNVQSVFDLGGDSDFSSICRLLKSVRGGVISLPQGISHLCFALGVRNYLFINQGPWGRNPEAICISSQVCNVPVHVLVSALGIQTMPKVYEPRRTGLNRMKRNRFLRAQQVIQKAKSETGL